MEFPNVYIGFASMCKDADELKKRSEYNILKSKNISGVNIIARYNNRKPLPQVYNEFIKLLGNEKDTVLICVHDDVCFTNNTWVKDILSKLKEMQVVGFAGGSNPIFGDTNRPPLWHLMCEKGTHSGIVHHVHEGGVFPTQFGETPKRVLILDGLCLAFKPNVIKEAGVSFDETNPCIAHFYDIDFCLTANKHRLKLSTVKSHIIHNSPGLREYTEDWMNGARWFLNKVENQQY